MFTPCSGNSGSLQGNGKGSKRRGSDDGWNVNDSTKRAKIVTSIRNTDNSIPEVSTTPTTTPTSSNGPENRSGSIIESPSSSSSAEDASFASNTSLTTPSRCTSSHPTHDTSRTSFHIKDLATFATTLEEAAKSAFPNRGRSRYATVNVCSIRWAEDEAEVCRRVQPELERLCDVFERGYGFKVEKWTIPSAKSHRTLMGKALDFIEDFDSRDNLFIVYYAGHGTINENRQSVWCCKRDPQYASVDWSSIQSLFDDALSDVLIFLDCCAAASSVNTSGNGTNETIAACGFERIAPPPGPHSFTKMLVEVLDEWKSKPYFSVSLLHSEVLFQLKRKTPDRGREGRRMEWCRTPVHYISSSAPRPASIELSRIRVSDEVANSLPYSPRLSDAEKQQAASQDDQTNSATSASPDGELAVPHVLISVALEEDQGAINIDSCRLWLSRFPALVKYAKIQGVFKSHSTLLLLSLPVVIWNMLPENPACSFISFIMSDNLACKTPGLDENTISEPASAPSVTIKEEEAIASAAGSAWRQPTCEDEPEEDARDENGVDGPLFKKQSPEISAEEGVEYTAASSARSPVDSLQPPLGTEARLHWPIGTDPQRAIPPVKPEPHLHWPIGNKQQDSSYGGEMGVGERDPQPPIQPAKSETHLYWPIGVLGDDSQPPIKPVEMEPHLHWPSIPPFKAELNLKSPTGNDHHPPIQSFEMEYEPYKMAPEYGLYNMSRINLDSVLRPTGSDPQLSIPPAIGGMKFQTSDKPILQTLCDQEMPFHKTSKQLPSASSTSKSKYSSDRSENLVTCQTCKRFKGRPCELRKHMKRHEGPYGCTFLTCNKTFGSKNDWKGHENSQHFHLETWRCDQERIEGGACAKVCYRRQSFQEHLVKAHQLSDSDIIKAKLDNCRIGRNCQSRFWCGFCNKLVDLKKRGVEAWTERFDHIDDHFMGRPKLPKQSIRDWVPMDSDRPKGEVESPHSLDSANEGWQAASGSSAGKSLEFDTTGYDEDNAGLKIRKSSSGDEETRRPEDTKMVKMDTVVYCCQCSTPHNPKDNLKCTGCPFSPHKFCSNCKVELVPSYEYEAYEQNGFF